MWNWLTAQLEYRCIRCGLCRHSSRALGFDAKYRNGLHLYAHTTQINGTIVNGTIQTATTGNDTATQVVVTTQPPASVTAGSSFALTIAVENVSNSVVTNYTGSVTVTLGNNSGGSTLAGSYILLTNNGVATFSGLTLNKSGSGYTLVVTSGTHTAATSSPLSVTPGVATQLLITSQPSATVTAGTISA